MTHAVLRIGAFLALVGIQNGFLAPLPPPFPFIPVVFVTGVYLIQRHLAASGAWLIAAYGIVLDLFRLGSVRGETLAFATAAGAAVLLSRHVFSNRSAYGVFGTAMAAFAVLTAVRAGILGFGALRDPGGVLWIPFATEAAWTAGCIAVSILIALPLVMSFSKRVRRH